LKISYVSQSKIPSREANSIHVMKMCSAFATEGHDVTLFIPETLDVEPDIDNVFEFYGVHENFEIKRLKLFLPNYPKWKHLRYSFMTANYICRRRFDYVIGRDIHTCYFSAELFKIPTFFEKHAPIHKTGIALFNKLISSAWCLKLIVITNALKEQYIEQYKMDAENIYVAPDGADKIPESIIPAKLIDKSNGMFNVGYIGHLYKGRGMEIIEDIAIRCPYAFFHIIGGKKDDIAYWENKLEHLENIHFYGFVAPSQAASFGKSMDVLIAPYQKEVYTAGGLEKDQSTANWMSPLKIFEYMAIGKPIICSDMPVLREVLEDGVNGVLCPCDDINAWCTAIERLYKDKAWASQLSENAKKMFEKYTWRQRAKGLAEIMRSETQKNKTSNGIYIVRLVGALVTLLSGVINRKQ